MKERSCPRWLRWRIHDVTKLRWMRWFDTCRWLCQPLKTCACIYPPACRAPWVREKTRRIVLKHWDEIPRQTRHVYRPPHDQDGIF